MSIAESLLTVAEYLRTYSEGERTELVRGKVVAMNPPKPRHGKICARITRKLDEFSEEHDLGHVVGNDTGVLIDVQTLRGADVAFFSFARVPREAPDDYWQAAPEVVFEVLSPGDRWTEVQDKVSDYLRAGALAVAVVDDSDTTVHLFRSDRPPQTFTADQPIVLPPPLEGFRPTVRELIPA